MKLMQLRLTDGAGLELILKGDGGIWLNGTDMISDQEIVSALRHYARTVLVREA